MKHISQFPLFLQKKKSYIQWGGLVIWFGCFLDAFLVRFPRHVPLRGDPEEDPEYTRATIVSRLAWKRLGSSPSALGEGSLGFSAYSLGFRGRVAGPSEDSNE